ncbi:putative lipid II flippase FtsW [Aromatoleum toluclasticum]|uniref:putative lipid II flippase FtsW n=1 Tax=Aromatoleum toluclasticum TaxID=92003 RepID=UPI001D191AEA|nr:putative lipid II flippase FtsW [Aromatoleum toluclasticum]MCC4117907.1 putative lipid II flippase FtsW [Aromatoleum toluclasticum]
MKFVSALSGWITSRNAGGIGSDTSRAVNRLMRPQTPARDLDPLLIWSAAALLLIGLVMVYSSSIAIAEGSKFTGYQQYYFVIRHAIFLAIGVIGGLTAFQVTMRQWQQFAPLLFLAGLALLVVVLIPGVGREVNGAQRWLPLGPVNLQPSELMKLFAALYAADYTVRKLPDMGSFRRGFLPMAVTIVLVGFLLLREPDFGAFVVVAAIAFGVLFLGGINVRVFVLLAIVAVIGLALLVWLSPYRRDRLFGFMDPWQDAFGKGYQLSHALIAFGRGEWFGVGLGASVEKLFYLPEAHTDFLLAVIAEELGFVGVLTIVVLFAILVHRAMMIGREAIKLERYFSGLVAMGIGLWIGVQSFINMGVNTGLLPTKGLTLPLMSFGGSGIVANCVALAILLRVDWENRQVMRGRS